MKGERVFVRCGGSASSALDRPEATIDLKRTLPNNDGRDDRSTRSIASGDGGRELPPEDAPLSLEDTLSKIAAREVDCAMAASESTGRSARDADLQMNHTGRLLKKSFWRSARSAARAARKKKCTRKKALRHVTRLG